MEFDDPDADDDHVSVNIGNLTDGSKEQIVTNNVSPKDSPKPRSSARSSKRDSVRANEILA